MTAAASAASVVTPRTWAETFACMRDRVQRSVLAAPLPGIWYTALARWAMTSLTTAMTATDVARWVQHQAATLPLNSRGPRKTWRVSLGTLEHALADTVAPLWRHREPGTVLAALHQAVLGMAAALDRPGASDPWATWAAEALHLDRDLARAFTPGGESDLAASGALAALWVDPLCALAAPPASDPLHQEGARDFLTALLHVVNSHPDVASVLARWRTWAGPGVRMWTSWRLTRNHQAAEWTLTLDWRHVGPGAVADPDAPAAAPAVLAATTVGAGNGCWVVPYHAVEEATTTWVNQVWWVPTWTMEEATEYQAQHPEVEWVTVVTCTAHVDPLTELVTACETGRARWRLHPTPEPEPNPGMGAPGSALLWPAGPAAMRIWQHAYGPDAVNDTDLVAAAPIGSRVACARARQQAWAALVDAAYVDASLEALCWDPVDQGPAVWEWQLSNDAITTGASRVLSRWGVRGPSARPAAGDPRVAWTGHVSVFNAAPGSLVATMGPTPILVPSSSSSSSSPTTAPIQDVHWQAVDPYDVTLATADALTSAPATEGPLFFWRRFR